MNQSPNHYFGALVLKHFGEHEKAEDLKARGKPSQEILDVIQAMEDSEDKVS